MEKKANIELDHSLKLIAKSSIIVFIGVLLSKLLSYFYKIIVARNFGPETYGIFTLALIVIGVLITLASLGLPEGLLRFVALYKGQKDIKKATYLFKFSLIAIFISSIFFSILLYVFAEQLSINFFHNADLTIYLKVLSLTIPLSALTSIFLSVLKGFQKVALYSFIVNIFHNTLKVVLLFLFIIIGFKDKSLVYSYFFSALGVLVISYLGVKSYLKKITAPEEINKNTKKKVLSELIVYSWPIIFLGAITTLFYWIDSIVIGHFKGTAEVGFYNVVFTIVTLFGIAPELFMQLFFPIIVEHFSKNNLVTIREISKQVSKWIFIINVPLLLLMLLFPGAIINILFGADYLSGKNALIILAVGNFIGSLTIPLCNNLLSMKGKSKWILTNLIVASIFNLILNLIFVPKYGMEGAAIITAATWILLSLALLLEVRHLFSYVPLRKKMIRVFFVSLIPSIFLIALSGTITKNLVSLIVAVSFFLIVYLFCIIVSGCLDNNDRIILSSIKNKLNVGFKSKNNYESAPLQS